MTLRIRLSNPPITDTLPDTLPLTQLPPSVSLRTVSKSLSHISFCSLSLCLCMYLWLCLSMYVCRTLYVRSYRHRVGGGSGVRGSLKSNSQRSDTVTDNSTSLQPSQVSHLIDLSSSLSLTVCLCLSLCLFVSLRLSLSVCLHVYGTIYHWTLPPYHLCWHLSND